MASDSVGLAECGHDVVIRVPVESIFKEVEERSTVTAGVGERKLLSIRTDLFHGNDRLTATKGGEMIGKIALEFGQVKHDFIDAAGLVDKSCKSIRLIRDLSNLNRNLQSKIRKEDDVRAWSGSGLTSNRLRRSVERGVRSPAVDVLREELSNPVLFKLGYEEEWRRVQELVGTPVNLVEGHWVRGNEVSGFGNQTTSPDVHAVPNPLDRNR